MLQRLMIIFVLMIFVILNSCNIRTQKEKDLLYNLENKYVKYNFSSYDVYLKVNATGEIDTNEIIDIYLSEIVMEDSITEGKYFFDEEVPWVYLNVYKRNKFEFQITMDIYGSSEIYFLNREYY